MSDRQPEENDNLLNFIASTVESIRDRMATKDDVIRLDARIDRLEGKVDNLEDRMGRLEVKIDKVEVDTTAIRGDLEQVHLRLDGIDKAVSSRADHVEAEMSRMRSVLYLLVKDRPDMLRLLGQSPPAGG
jgi:predicted nuclease with TOPRIM domain